MVYALGDVGTGNGMSWTYFNPHRTYNQGLGVSMLSGENQWSRPYGIVISTATYKTEFNEIDVKKWNPQMRSALAYLVDNGYLKVDIDSVGAGVTGDQIRSFF